jgi:hypothetical protein
MAIGNLKIESYVPAVRNNEGIYTEYDIETTGNLIVGGDITLTDDLTIDSLTTTGSITVDSNSATALTVGNNGATNPVLKIDASTASQATGVSVTGAAAAGGVDVAVISSGTNESLTLNAKGTGTITLNNTGTGNVSSVRKVVVMSALATPAGGQTGAGIQFGTTTNLGIFYGSGAPTLTAAQGALYLRSDGSSTSTRLYVNTDGATTWTNVTTAA